MLHDIQEQISRLECLSAEISVINGVLDFLDESLCYFDYSDSGDKQFFHNTQNVVHLCNVNLSQRVSEMDSALLGLSRQLLQVELQVELAEY